MSNIMYVDGGVIYLDSLSPFIEVDTLTYAKMINDLQVDNGNFW